MSDLTDKEFYEICDLLRFKYTWSNPDYLKGIKDIIKATKDNMRSELANCFNERIEPVFPIQSITVWAYIRKHLKPILIGFATGITLMSLFSLIENIVLKIALIIHGG